MNLKDWMVPTIWAVLVALSITLRLIDSFALPSAKPTSSPVTEFSGERAFLHLESIAQAPHPWNSVENTRVFNYIMDFGKQLEDKYGKDKIESQSQWYNTTSAEDADVANAVFLIKGLRTGLNASAIQVSAHYDSVQESPGANDDGASCAVMLELASVLASASARLERDVLLLFVDAEEEDLIGSYQFYFGHQSLDIQPHPWSSLPSVVINLEGSGSATSKEALIRSNSLFATKMYHKYAPSPSSFSLTELLYRVIDIGDTDGNVYWMAGLHLIDLIWVENRWAYHNPDDNVDNVNMGSLQHEGNNILSMVRGVSNDSNFPDRIPPEELEEKQVIENRGRVGMASGKIYFSLLLSSSVCLSVGGARVMFVVLALVMAFSMPFILPGLDEFSEGKCKHITKHALIALGNFIFGVFVCIAVFGVFGSWKVVSEDNVFNDFVWARKGDARTVLSFFSLCCSTYLVYALVRVGWKGCCQVCLCKKKDREIGVHFVTVPDDLDLERKEGGVIKIPNTADSGTPLPPLVQGFEEDAAIQDQETPASAFLETVGMLSHVGIFYFYDCLLLVFGAAMPDVACLVFFPSLFLWMGTAVEALIRRFLPATGLNGASDQWRVWKAWAARGFVATIPSLLLIPDGLFILVKDFGFFLDDLGLWYGAPAVEAFCIGFILPLVVPYVILLPTKYTNVLGIVCLVGFLTSAIVCMVI